MPSKYAWIVLATSVIALLPRRAYRPNGWLHHTSCATVRAREVRERGACREPRRIPDAREPRCTRADHATGRQGHRVRAAGRGRRLRRDLVALPSHGLDARLGVDRGPHGPGGVPGQPAHVLRAAHDD